MKKVLSFFTLAGLLFPLKGNAFSSATSHGLAEDIYYIRLGMGYFNAGSSSTVAPLIGAGRRFAVDEAAIDLSAAWAGRESHRGNRTTYYALPKITYLQFAQPSATTSFFCGGGLSWSSISKDEASKFRGLFGQVVVGYEFKRQVRCHPTLQLEMSQPLIAQQKSGQFPGPSALVTLSLSL